MIVIHVLHMLKYQLLIAVFLQGGVQSFSTIDVKEEIKKGQAAKAQISTS